jgi:serine/threonine protein kinase
MWSCGCILGEMLGRKPLFPGKNFVHQLQLILEVIGSPKLSQVAHITNQQARKFLDSQMGRKKMNLKSLYPGASESALSLLDQLLLFDPEDRATVDDALTHNFLTDNLMNKDSLSDIYPPTSLSFEFEFERSSATKQQLKGLIQQESISLRREKHTPIRPHDTPFDNGHNLGIFIMYSY